MVLKIEKKNDMKLRIENLAIGYTQTILEKINLEARSGQLIALIGANGSGKSTFLKTLAGILSPLKGGFYLDEMNITQLNPKERAKYIGIVLTDKLDMPLSVFDFLSLGRQTFTGVLDRLTDSDYKVISQIMSELDLNKYKTSKVNELSDGERQKVLIARALIQETPVLLLDEPTTHLDIENKAMLLQQLIKISKEQQKIIILSTHDINLILPKTSKIWFAKEYNSINEINNKQLYSENLFNSNLIRFDSNCNIFRLI